MAQPRGAGYSHEEDRHLCTVRINVSRNPRSGHLWDVVTATYNTTKPSTAMPNRNKRSLESRMHIIQRAVLKLNECIHHIKCSGLYHSEEDIYFHAKQLMRQDPRFRSGFKFNHVWSIMKDFDPKKGRRRTNTVVLDVASEAPVENSDE